MGETAPAIGIHDDRLTTIMMDRVDVLFDREDDSWSAVHQRVL